MVDFTAVSTADFNKEVNAFVSSLKSAPKQLVILAASAGYRYDTKDSCSAKVMENFVNQLAEKSILQAKLIKAFKTFAPVDFEQTEDSKGKDEQGKLKPRKYTAKNIVEWKTLSKEQKDAYKAAIAEFEKLDSVNDFDKKESGDYDNEKARNQAVAKVKKFIAQAVEQGAYLNNIKAVEAVIRELTNLKQSYLDQAEAEAAKNAPATDANPAKTSEQIKAEAEALLKTPQAQAAVKNAESELKAESVK
ncbi:hypothetical protein FV395_23295 [Salmonella enterica]|nr:hypothetical protein [Salmonella enterica]